MRDTGGLSSLRDRARELTTRDDDGEPRDGSDDTMWDRVTESSTIAPVHGNPTLEPSDQPWELAMLAGWGDPDGEGRGHDALGGIDDMVVGDTDALGELSAELEDGHGPLALRPDEGIHANVKPDNEMGYEPRRDWCSYL